MRLCSHSSAEVIDDYDYDERSNRLSSAARQRHAVGWSWLIFMIPIPHGLMYNTLSATKAKNIIGAFLLPSLVHHGVLFLP